MPTKKKRMVLTLEDDTYKSLQRLGQIAEMPASTFLARHFLPEVIPLMEQIAELVAESRKAPAEALRGMQRLMAEAAKEAAEVQLDIADLIEQENKKKGTRPDGDD